MKRKEIDQESLERFLGEVSFCLIPGLYQILEPQVLTMTSVFRGKAGAQDHLIEMQVLLIVGTALIAMDAPHLFQGCEAGLQKS